MSEAFEILDTMKDPDNLISERSTIADYFTTMGCTGGVVSGIIGNMVDENIEKKDE